ncbi:MAG: hypothetical protein LBK77_09565, partial [Spirochaetaceae bacterium]|nr:hypothetical protein [Spirochaetaceae bacterium]
ESGTENGLLVRRRKDLINFDYGDSGKTVYIAVQIENGEKRPLGPDCIGGNPVEFCKAKL